MPSPPGFQGGAKSDHQVGPNQSIELMRHKSIQELALDQLHALVEILSACYQRGS